MTFTLLCRHNFVTYLTYWKLHMSCLKMFSYILQVFVRSVWCCTVSNFYHIHYIFIIYCSGGGGFVFVYLRCWMAAWCLIELISTGYGQIMEMLDNMGKKWFVLAAWIECYCFVCLCCIVPVSLHYRLYLVTVCMKVLQNGRLLRFSKRPDCWCKIRCSICNQNGHFIRCIQSSSFQGYDDRYKSWENIIN